MDRTPYSRLPEPLSESFRSEVFFATASGWYMVDRSGLLHLHHISEKLQTLCRTCGITPESGTRFRGGEVFFLKSKRGSDHPFGKIPPTIQSFDIDTGGLLQRVEFERHYRLYLAGITVRNGRAYYWSGYEVFEFTTDRKQKFLCKVRNPISSLTVVLHNLIGFSFYYNTQTGHLYFHSSSPDDGPKSRPSIICGMMCHLIGSHDDVVFGWRYTDRHLYVIDKGHILRKRAWLCQPAELITAGKDIYMLFDGRIEIINSDDLSVKTIWTDKQGTLAVSETSRF